MNYPIGLKLNIKPHATRNFKIEFIGEDITDDSSDLKIIEFGLCRRIGTNPSLINFELFYPPYVCNVKYLASNEEYTQFKNNSEKRRITWQFYDSTQKVRFEYRLRIKKKTAIAIGKAIRWFCSLRQ